MEKELIIYILHYNNYQKTKLCLDSILKHTINKIEIIIIDNFSTNNSLHALKEYTKYKDIEFIENKENLGYAKANNLAIRDAKQRGFQYAYLLNNDTEIIGENHFDVILDVIKKDSKIGILAPKIVDITKNGHSLNTNQSVYLKLLEMVKVLNKRKTTIPDCVEVLEAHGAALVVNVDAFLKCRGFPWEFFMYGEESVLSKRMIWNNYKILWLINADIYVLHHHDMTGHVESWRSYLMGRNRAIEYYYYRKNKLIRWSIVYCLFYIYIFINKKRQKYYFEGMKDGKKIRNYSKKEIYLHAINKKNSLS